MDFNRERVFDMTRRGTIPPFAEPLNELVSDAQIGSRMLEARAADIGTESPG
jgi:hypothetical protein